MNYLIITLLIGLASFLCYILKWKSQILNNLHKRLYIVTVSDEKVCNKVVSELQRRIESFHIIGFDCEWVTVNGKRNPVALLQLSTYDGYCALFRLNQLKCVPESLRELLEDNTIYKVGVAPGDDAKYLYLDYSVSLQSTLDIRHIVQLSGHQVGGLAMLSQTLLGVTLDKSWRTRCSDWEATELSEKQKNYAALDGFVAVHMVVKLLKNHNPNSIWSYVTGYKNDTWNNFEKLLWPYVDTKYGNSMPVNLDVTKQKSNGKKLQYKKNTASTRSKPLYHNCFLQAPDGELLCTCDVKKAMWYKEKGLADIVNEDPLTARLRFEPAGRSVGDVGMYYRLTKENRCVVCGADQSYIKKNVVPREYRKYFPEVMKDHSCHDVLLLCMHCHQRSNISDIKVREALAKECNAPLSCKGFTKRTEDKSTKAVRAAANTILRCSDKIPAERRKSLEKRILEYYTDHSEITPELLEEASDLFVFVENTDYEAHGQKVVEYYSTQDGGLLKLEQMWREHFLKVMRPQYMPRLWSVKHNEERLRVRLLDGRLTEEDLKVLRLDRSALAADLRKD